MTATPSRSALCPCGSGKKYKRCHGAVSAPELPAAPTSSPTKPMGYFTDYIRNPLPADQMDVERRKLLGEIGHIRNCAVLSYAALMMPPRPGVITSIVYDDLLLFADTLRGLHGDRVCVLLETPGGIGEVGRQMVEMLHAQFKHVEFIIPGWAKSTGTIMVMGGHEILMSAGSALGPIDAQLTQDGKTFSADALIEGLDSIKAEVEQSGKLNPAYIPILQKISPGEIQHARNALAFARETVQEWLIKYKFSAWTQHARTGAPVTEQEREATASAIAERLCSQGHWKTHGRSIGVAELRALGLRVKDYGEDPKLLEAVSRYHVLLRMTFAGNVSKIIESSDQTLAVRYDMIQQARPPQQGAAAPSGSEDHVFGVIEPTCPKCNAKPKVQLDWDPGVPLQPGNVRYPNNDQLACPSCGNPIDMGPVRAQVEAQFGRPALRPQPTS